MYQPAVGVRRPVVDLTVLFDLLDKEQFAQTVHVVCGLHVEHLGYYGVQPPGGVPLYDGHLLLEAVQHLQVCKYRGGDLYKINRVGTTDRSKSRKSKTGVSDFYLESP